MTRLSVAFVGLGYIGLPTAVVLARSGVNVTGIDVNASNVERINKGEVPIIEPGLEDQLRGVLATGKFRASTEYLHADAYIVAVPTPFADDHNVDMKFIYAVADSIAPHLKGGELIVLESTSPPHTTAKMAQRVLSKRPDLVADGSENPDNLPVIYFAHCPERILPGNAMEELVTNDRIIGGMTPTATKMATDIYRSFCEGELLPTDAVTAEMAKLTENSFRDVNIAFANELSIICDRLGVDVWELIELANHHPRVNILQPGPGVGGHCIAVDPWFIVAADPENSRLIRSAREINDGKPEWVLNKVEEAVTSAADATIAVLGLAFKANIDDLRESPALSIATQIATGYPAASVLTVEPNINALPPQLAKHENVRLVGLDQALESAETIIVLVDHDEFTPAPATALRGKKVIDTKGLWR